MSSGHSILAPSGAETWSRCVGAPHLSRGLPQVDREYNASGSCSHWIMNYGFEHPQESIQQFLGKTMKFGESPPFDFVIDQDRLDRVQLVIDEINREPGDGWYEQRLNTTPIFGVPNQEGHADVVKYDPTGIVQIHGVAHKGVLSVHDLKDGYLLVNAKNNLQGLSYIAAALHQYDVVGEINACRFVIHQPKIKHYDEWAYTREELEAFVTVIRPVAKLVYDIYHGIVPFDPAVHLNAGEEQCFWCPVRGRCPARARHIMSLFEPLINRHELDDEMFGLIYGKLDEISQAVKDYHAEAMRRAMMGKHVPGQKLVMGYPGDRAWVTPEKAENILAMTVPEAQMYAPRKLATPTQIEKTLKQMKQKELYASIAQYIVRAAGSPTLAPLADKRPELSIASFGLTTESNEDLV